jgi:hypothetical protein
MVNLEISLELNNTQGKDVSLMPALYFQVLLLGPFDTTFRLVWTDICNNSSDNLSLMHNKYYVTTIKCKHTIASSYIPPHVRSAIGLYLLVLCDGTRLMRQVATASVIPKSALRRVVGANANSTYKSAICFSEWFDE